ncbi:hypothetical protein YC2023_068925 [Brassica napus]
MGTTLLNVLLIHIDSFYSLWSKQFFKLSSIDDDHDATCQNHIYPRSSTSHAKLERKTIETLPTKANDMRCN